MIGQEEEGDGKRIEQKDELVTALDKLGEGSKLLWLVFALTATPTLFNGLHATSYVFLAEVPTHWCAVPQLTMANWTDVQIRNISSASSCRRFSHNYTHLATLDFEGALAYVKANGNPGTESCNTFSYTNDIDGSSIVAEWDLVCHRTALRSSVQMALSLGKFLGASIFGIIADKFGRRTSYIVGVLILIVSGPISAFAPWYWLFMILRGLIGASGSAIYHSSFTTLTEVAGPKHRAWMGIVYSMGYPLGMMILPGIAYWAQDWKLLQLSITLPAVILLLHCWLMPESPRWLIAQNRRKEAQIIIERSYGPVYPSVNIALTAEKEKDMQCAKEKVANNKSGKETFVEKWKSLIDLFSHAELRKRIIIAYFAWAATSLSYYAIALNVDNFSANRYLYTFLTGVSEIPAYLVPLPLLAFMGRRAVTSLLFSISGIALLSILAIPQSDTTAIMVVALTGRLTVAAVFSVIILHTSELFPTVSRNSAVGTSSTMAHVGSIAAPYVVDLLGAKAWWIPSTICGATAVVAGLLSLILPETRRRTLVDTVEEEVTEGRGKVSIKNCFSFR
ncbi:organic cation transporter protein isoform X2 [Athalia rosae]|nr:organic cation transporter protein isoform X2 [Athalia rosae]XP_012262133.2 organic cation transporter protein isoform X2 [Athalia rosae]XP_012262134.2 organic cation transporter protein isoform X2 [Athalia rosae]XP_012262136.2 organic cation transporter protein isoform X2 [Athalia rosae]XP_020710040.2 organic cation transporter protein isoform X2 [Athalia rosae]XP_048509653.1 organic cation transporter protein isoform X2 [Athalia rosae]XP_048509654.1 organic cation transporter protein iso